MRRTRAAWGSALLLAFGFLPLLAPTASALSIETYFEDGRFRISAFSDTATEKLEVVVTHEDDVNGTMVDAILALEIPAGERVILDAGPLPERAYDVHVVPRGSYEDRPAPSPSSSQGALEVQPQQAFPWHSTNKATLDMDGRTAFFLREGNQGEIRFARSDDGGRGWWAPQDLVGPGPENVAGWTYWETARFGDGSLAVLAKQSRYFMPGAAPWTLLRVDETGALLTQATVALPEGRTIPTTDRLELLSLPDGRVLLIGQTFARDPTPDELRHPASLDVWTLETDGSLKSMSSIPMKSGIEAKVRAVLGPDGTIHVVWTHPAPAPDDRPFWTARSTDGGMSFEPARPLDVALAGGDAAFLVDAAVDGEGTLLVLIAAMRPESDGAVHSVPFLLRLEPGGGFSQLDLRAVKTHPTQDRAGYDLLGLLADGPRVWVFVTDMDLWVFESFDSGRTFGPPIRLEGRGGAALSMQDLALTRSGVPVFATRHGSCEGCFAALSPEIPLVLIEEPALPWGPEPIDLQPIGRPPMLDRPPIEPTLATPINGAPGPAVGIVALAIAALALLVRRRFHR